MRRRLARYDLLLCRMYRRFLRSRPDDALARSRAEVCLELARRRLTVARLAPRWRRAFETGSHRAFDIGDDLAAHRARILELVEQRDELHKQEIANASPRARAIMGRLL
jgi:hypothetical protein